MNKSNIYVGLLGCGTVGGGVWKVFARNRELIQKRLGCDVSIKKVLEKDVEKAKAAGVPESIISSNLDEILYDEDIDIVVEVIGGTTIAGDFIKQALSAGKSVVTANKDLLAQDGEELYRLAAENGVDLLFEASVGGGIPIIRPLKECLSANRVEAIYGIVNGTTNYMLTKMCAEGSNYDDVLAEAKAKGYAEADPTSDVEGYDAARKLAILASIAFNTRVSFKDVFVEGITGITARDIMYAKELNYAVKLLAIGKENDGEVEVRVHPTLIPLTHPLASVNDVFNAIFVCGDAVGDVMFYGRGAGELPTASAIAGDVIAAARNILTDSRGRLGCTCYDQKPIKNTGETRSKYYVRMKVLDKPGVLAAIATVFGNQEVSLASVLQKRNIENIAEIVWVTHNVLEKNVQDALKIIGGLSIVEEISNVIRVEGE
ncbi:MAG: homoserine dehydrogenase [Thermincola sp.]|jgi:homoserine dehydrogenase|nr:homoserine dehydrogenase [Thermincola sp.]MDT3701603.1 homoserine dehydrogenase [Thermincola sp.]